MSTAVPIGDGQEAVNMQLNRRNTALCQCMHNQCSQTTYEYKTTQLERASRHSSRLPQQKACE